MDYTHTPVLLNEVIEYLRIKKDGIYVDCTFGGGGHSRHILKRLGANGKLIAIDQDEFCFEITKEEFKKYKNIIFINGNFSDIKHILIENSIKKCAGILFDLGVSSFQLEVKERGFSFNYDAPLDMRMNTKSSLTARDLVNNLSIEELSSIIYKYGNERWAKRIAKFITKKREKSPIETTKQLVDIIAEAIPPINRPQNIHFATRTFQALRIAVNNELDNLKKGLTEAIDMLGKGGRVCVICFHSLEDRIVKHIFLDLSKGCTCPGDFPVCVCGRNRTLKIVTKKPIVPSKEEVLSNNRARSAKLRVAEKI